MFLPAVLTPNAIACGFAAFPCTNVKNRRLRALLDTSGVAACCRSTMPPKVTMVFCRPFRVTIDVDVDSIKKWTNQETLKHSFLMLQNRLLFSQSMYKFGRFFARVGR